jgi:hypothetical protein
MEGYGDRYCVCLLQKRLLQLPNGDLQCRVRSVNKRDTMSCVTSYIQQGPGTIRDVCLNELLNVSSRNGGKPVWAGRIAKLVKR